MKVKSRLDEQYNDFELDGLYLASILSPWENEERKELEKIINKLKDGNSQEWATSEVLQRLIYLLGNTDGFDLEKD